jgi:hypothetical protein
MSSRQVPQTKTPFTAFSGVVERFRRNLRDIEAGTLAQFSRHQRPTEIRRLAEDLAIIECHARELRESLNRVNANL